MTEGGGRTRMRRTPRTTPRGDPSGPDGAGGSRPGTGRRRRTASGAACGPLLLPSVVALLLSLLLPAARAGLSFGGVTSTNECYDALVSARDPTLGRLDRDAYVTFVNELSGDAFTAFRYDEEGGWGMYPATEFGQLPPAVRGEFYRHACGGAFVICDSAYLYADGADTGRDPSPDAQQEVYLYQVCLGVEGAIEEARPEPAVPATTGRPSAEPTARPTAAATERPTASPVAVRTVTVPLTFQVVVSGNVTAGEMATPGDGTRQSLLLAVTLWSDAVARGYFDAAAGQKRKKKRKGNGRPRDGAGGLRRLGGPGGHADGRELIGYASPLIASPPTDVSIVEDECWASIVLAPGDRCLLVTANLTLTLVDEPDGAAGPATAHFLGEFERDVTTGLFYLYVPEDDRGVIKAVILEPPRAAAELPTGGPARPPSGPVPVDPGDGDGGGDPGESGGTSDFADLLKGLEGDQTPEKSGGNAGAIAAGVLVPLAVLAAAGLFVTRRRRTGRTLRKFGSKKGYDPADDLGGARYGSRGSGRSFSAGSDSDGSDSIESYSSHSSSDSDETSSNYTGTSSRSSSYVSTTSQSESTAASSAAGALGAAEPPAPAPFAPLASPYALPADGGSSSRGSSRSSFDGSRGSFDGSRSSGGATPFVPPAPADDDGGSSSHGGSSRSSSRDGSSVHSAGDDDRSAFGPGYVGSKYGDTPGLGAIPEGPASESGSSTASRSSSRDSRRSGKGSGQSSARGAGTDDSSAGSSGWESGDGDSSIDSADVSSFDGDLDSAGNSTAITSGDAETLTSEEVREIVNPAVNPVVQRGVTMLPLAEVDDETEGDLLDSDLMDSDLFASLETGPTGGTDSTGGTHSTREPVAGEIQDAIEAGNWEAVGQTAAMLSGEDMDNATRESASGSSRSSRSWQSSNYSGSTATGTGGHGSGAHGSDGSTYEDAAKAAEIDGLVETGDWDGVVAVAARYAEEASEAESDLISRHSGRGYRTSSSGYPTSSSGYPTSSSGYPTSNSGATGSSGTVSGITAPDTRTDSAHSSLLSKASSAEEEDSRAGSVGSVSVETADETNSAYSSSTRGGRSYVTGTSMDTSRDLSPETASRGTDASSTIADSRSGSSTVSGSGPGHGAPGGFGGPHASAASSMTNDDLTSTGSTFTGTLGGPDPEVRQQKAYRAEVEALVRRVVPDEIDNVDDIMVQFSGREEELIETLRAMQEKSIAQRARAAVQRSAKMEGRAAGRTPERRRGGFDDSHSSGMASEAPDGQDSTAISEASGGTGFDNRTATTASGMSSVAGTSITEEFTEGGDGDSRGSDYSSGSGSSGYSTRGSYYSDDEDNDGYGRGDSRGSSARRSGRSSPGSDRKSGSARRSARSGGSSTNIDDLIDGGDWGGIISAANSMSGGHLSGDDSDLD